MKVLQWWKDGEVKIWQTDAERISLTVTGDLSNNDYGVFVQNNATDEQKMMKYEALANQALASGGAEYFDFVLDMISSENSSEAKAIVIKGMKTLREQQQAIQQQQIQVQQQAVAVQEQANALKEKELEIKATVPIRVAEIQSGTKENIKNREIEHDENKSEIENNQDNEKLAFQQSMEVLKGGNKKSS